MLLKCAPRLSNIYKPEKQNKHMKDVQVVGVVLAVLGSIGMIVFGLDAGNLTGEGILSVIVFAVGLVLGLRDWGE
jgi:hypothetical protein